MSLQEFLLGELVDGARTQSPAEVVPEVERRMAETAGKGFASTGSSEHVRSWRNASCTRPRSSRPRSRPP